MFKVGDKVRIVCLDKLHPLNPVRTVSKIITYKNTVLIAVLGGLFWPHEIEHVEQSPPLTKQDCM